MTVDTSVRGNPRFHLSSDVGPGMAGSDFLSLTQAIVCLLELPLRLEQLNGLLVAMTRELNIDEEGRVRLDVERATAVLYSYGIEDVAAADDLVAAVAGGPSTLGQVRRRLANAMFTRGDSSIFESLPKADKGLLRVERWTYENPLEIIVTIGVAVVAAMKGGVWAIEKYQGIRKTGLEIEKLKRDLDEGDAHREAVLRNLAPEPNEIPAAIVKATISVQLQIELDPAIDATPSLQLLSDALERLPEDLRVVELEAGE